MPAHLEMGRQGKEPKTEETRGNAMVFLLLLLLFSLPFFKWEERLLELCNV